MFTFKLEMQDVKVKKSKISRRRELQIKEREGGLFWFETQQIKSFHYFVIVKLSQDMQIKFLASR